METPGSLVLAYALDRANHADAGTRRICKHCQGLAETVLGFLREEGCELVMPVSLQAHYEQQIKEHQTHERTH